MMPDVCWGVTVLLPTSPCWSTQWTMAQPLRLLVDVINKVERGEFDPDLTRSGLFAKEAGNANDDGDDIVSSSCGLDDEDDRDIHAEEDAIEQVAGTWQQFSLEMKVQCLSGIPHRAAFTSSWMSLGYTWHVDVLCLQDTKCRQIVRSPSIPCAAPASKTISI